MKKSLIALLIGSSVLLSGCKDEKLAQKLLETEKQVAQLEAKLAETQALQVEIVELFNKSTVVKHPKDPNDEYAREETPVSVFASMAKTGVEWLDNLLLLNMLDEKERVNLNDKDEIKKALIAKFDQHYQEQLQSAKEDKNIGLEFLVTTYYAGQRNNIVTFTQINYSYTGGAHSSYYTKYLNVDVNKKAVIQLGDLVSPKNQAKLRDILWKYRGYHLNKNGNFDGFVEKDDFFVSDQFYFTSDSITFVYPEYIGYFSGDEIELTVSLYEINELLNPEYQRTEQRGWF